MKMNLQFFAGEVTGKIARKYMAHFLDAGFGGSAAEWSRLGKDLEEYNVELNPDTETKKNIIGENSFVHNGFEIFRGTFKQVPEAVYLYTNWQLTHK